MTVYSVIYSFTCPHCKHMQATQKLFRADNEQEASHRLSLSTLTCKFCTPPASFTRVVKTIVSPATDDDLSNNQLEPEP